MGNRDPRTPMERKILTFMKMRGGSVGQGAICRQFNISPAYRDLILNEMKTKFIVKQNRLNWGLMDEGTG